MNGRKHFAVPGGDLPRDVPRAFRGLGKLFHDSRVVVNRRSGLMTCELQELQRLTDAGLFLSCGAADSDGEQHRACWDNAVAQHGGLYVVCAPYARKA